ncbi:complement factor H-related protein 4-like [Scylla paramamosain]|uniref:complement factor H-related protein 4-like n=1 Tax=Scylla paramamosain TaxID=85552 RepID=UPI003082F0D2
MMSKVTVDCLEDHYNEENLINTTTLAHCTGDGWLIPHPCVRVCAEIPEFGNAPIDWGNRGRGRVTQEVILDCPEGYRNNDSLDSSITTVTCTLDGWVNLDECVQACVEDPDAATMNINWEPLLAILDTEVEVDCLDDHYSNKTLTTTTTTVQCLEEGWWVIHPCVRVCTEKPDFGNVFVKWEERGPGRVGDNMTLDCPAGYRSTDHLHLNNTFVTCTDQGWENIDPCVKVCLQEDLGGVAIEEEEPGVWRVDEVVTRACPEDLLTFDKALNISDFICTADGWANPDPCVNVCRERLYPVNGHANWDQRIWTAGHELLVVCLSQHHVSPDVYSYNVPCTDSGWHSVNSSCSYCEYSCVLHAH